MQTILVLALAIFLLNVPFGYWRAGVRKFGPAWFVAVHGPVPLAIGMRLAVGQGFRLATLPIYVLAFFLGQFAGGRLRRMMLKPQPAIPAGDEA